MAMQEMQKKIEKKEEQELELLSKKLGLDSSEKSKLWDLSRKFEVPAERIAATIFLNNATPNRLNWLKMMASNKNFDGKEKLIYSKIYEILMEISKSTDFQKEYREIKQEYFSLVNKIRDPDNMNIFRDYSKDLMFY